MSAAVFGWLRAREFKKAMDVKGGRMGGRKKGDDRSALETVPFPVMRARIQRQGFPQEIRVTFDLTRRGCYWN